MSRLLVPLLLLLVLIPTTSSAVDRLVPGQFATIGEAITASSDGARILVSEGIYPERVDEVGKAIAGLRVGGGVMCMSARVR